MTEKESQSHIIQIQGFCMKSGGDPTKIGPNFEKKNTSLKENFTNGIY